MRVTKRTPSGDPAASAAKATPYRLKPVALQLVAGETATLKLNPTGSNAKRV